MKVAPGLVVAVTVLFGGSVPTYGQEAGTASPTIHTRDLDNFWRAWDKAAHAATWADSVTIFEEEYRDAGSAGLADFFEYRIESVEGLLHEVRSAPRYYAQLRPQTAVVTDFVPEIQAILERWREIHPEADLPDVHFLIGRRTSGGIASPNGILIGIEMYGLTPETPDEELSAWLRDVLKPVDQIPGIVAHELIHTQASLGRTDTLLGRAIGEGAADFLGELISGYNINGHVHEWANPRESELWADFQDVMAGEDAAGWLYSARSKDEPADLGYWIGYKITRAYYERAEDKTAAVQDILTIQDYDAFLEASGYDPGG